MPLYSDFHAMNLGQLETEVLGLLWIDVTEDADGFAPVGSFIKYTRARIDRAINQAYAELAFVSNALRSWFILPLKANYTQYPVPPGIYDIEQVFLFNSATSYQALTVEELSFIEQRLSPGWMSYPGVPEYCYVGDKTGMRIKLGVAPASKSDATAVTVSSDALAAIRPIAAVDGIYGAAGAAAAGFNYVDAAGQDFSNLGVVAGLKIYNITTETTGVISSLATTVNPNDTIVTTTATWSPGDTMRILGGEVSSTISIGQDEATYLLAPSAGNLPIPAITMAANNLLVRGFTLPVKLMSLYQYPELTPYFHEAVALGAASFLGAKEPTESLEFKQAQVYAAQFQAFKEELKAFVANQYKTAPRIISRRRR